MDRDQLEFQLWQIRKSLNRCLHYLSEDLPPSRLPSYQKLLNDLLAAHQKLARALDIGKRE